MLNRYLNRLYDTIISRGDVEIEFLILDDQSRSHGSIKTRLKFYDGSFLEFYEIVIWRDERFIKLHYGYHYQNSAGDLIFRYDNAPHHPHIITYPHHKHVGTDIETQ